MERRRLDNSNDDARDFGVARARDAASNDRALRRGDGFARFATDDADESRRARE